MSDRKRLTIDLAPEVHEEMEHLADEQGCDIAELVKRAVALNRYVWANRDGELLTRDEQGNVQRVVMIGREGE